MAPGLPTLLSGALTRTANGAGNAAAAVCTRRVVGALNCHEVTFTVYLLVKLKDVVRVFQFMLQSVKEAATALVS